MLLRWLSRIRSYKSLRGDSQHLVTNPTYFPNISLKHIALEKHIRISQFRVLLCEFCQSLARFYCLGLQKKADY